MYVEVYFLKRIIMNDWGNSIKMSMKQFQIYNANYWQKMPDFIGLYHFEVIIQL